eukprot:02384.XXX_36038_36181_1 [CDS] Oithona nana genome sequencing.
MPKINVTLQFLGRVVFYPFVTLVTFYLAFLTLGHRVTFSFMICQVLF